jgi:hypothetical protein
MNPLQKEQYETLKSINCEDAARKINELVREMNKKPEYIPETNYFNSDAKFDDGMRNAAKAIHNADTLYDAKEILFDYVKKIK